MNLFFRKLVGNITAPFYLGYGGCGCCGRVWPICKSHTTDYEFDKRGFSTRGCFPLCQPCWEEMTPEQRLPYYEELWGIWVSQGTDKDSSMWEDIKAAVLAGG